MRLTKQNQDQSRYFQISVAVFSMFDNSVYRKSVPGLIRAKNTARRAMKRPECSRVMRRRINGCGKTAMLRMELAHFNLC